MFYLYPCNSCCYARICSVLNEFAIHWPSSSVKTFPRYMKMILHGIHLNLAQKEYSNSPLRFPCHPIGPWNLLTYFIPFAQYSTHCALACAGPYNRADFAWLERQNFTTEYNTLLQVQRGHFLFLSVFHKECHNRVF